MGVAENTETVRRFYAAGPSDDDRLRGPLASPDIVWHAPGSNHVSGTYRGAGEVFVEMGQRMQPLDLWSIDVIDVFGNADLVFATVHVRARRGSHAVDTPGGHVFRLDESATIVEAWGFVRDQAALDALFDAT